MEKIEQPAWSVPPGIDEISVTAKKMKADKTKGPKLGPASLSTALV